MPYDAVVFDYDGVLMEPTPIDVLQDAVRTAFADAGIEPRDDHVEDLAISVQYDRFLETCDHYGVDPVDFWHARDTAFTHHQTALLEDGGKRLYDDYDVIETVRFPRGIVSSNQQATLEHHLAHAGIDHLFHAVHGREPHPDSIRKKKPNPHYLHEALDALDADSALYVGDRDSDIEAAHNAGIDSAYIHRDHNNGATVTPTYELESLYDLRDILSETP